MSMYSLGKAVAENMSSDRATVGEANANGASDQTPLERFSRYIPGDIVGLYLLVFGVLIEYRDDDDPSKTRWEGVSFLDLTWGNYWVFFALVPVFVIGSFLISSTEDFRTSRKHMKHLWWAIGSGWVAYTCWVVAIPETPFGSLGIYTEGLAGAVAVVGSMALAYFERVAKKIDPRAVK